MGNRRFTAQLDKQFKKVAQQLQDQLSSVCSSTMDDVASGLRDELRAQVDAAGLGSGVANAWRGRRYPIAPSSSIGATAFVWSNAPKIIDAFDRAPVIVPVHGSRYLAIPTPNVPRAIRGVGRRGTMPRMTPHEVETFYNQDLKFARTTRGRIIAYIDVKGIGSAGIGRATGKQLGRLYRGTRALPRHTQIVMFILTPLARMPKRLSVEAAAQHWAAEVQPTLERRLSAI